MYRKRKELPGSETCYFCQENKEPSYKDYEFLTKFLTERGRIRYRLGTRLCARHQRRLTQEIKRARFLALLPFLKKVEPHA